MLTNDNSGGILVAAVALTSSNVLKEEHISYSLTSEPCCNSSMQKYKWSFIITVFSFVCFVFPQMGSGPGEAWCLQAGALESMEVLAPPSGWR